jgi:uncharacterized membrane protein (DUF2068 family)
MNVSTTQIARSRKRHDKGLVMIAAYKFFTTLVFAAVGIGALHLVGKDIGDVLSSLVSDLRFNPEGRFVNFVLDKASLLDDPMLRRIGFGAFCYAAVSIVEGVGLYLEKAWAEYLTLAITASFLPIEIRELMHRFTWARIGIFVINVVVLIYLVVIVIERQRKNRASAAAAR